MRKIKIGEFHIGENEQPFTIAEVGINHNGSLEMALEMISVAKESGANAVKFQTFKANEFIHDPTVTFTYQSNGISKTESMLEMFTRYELKLSDWKLIKEECDRQNILFLSTPQNFSDLEVLMQLGVPAIKIGSDDFNNLPLLKQYSKTKLPLIVSCGMANLAEIYEALETIGTFEGYPTILLLCTSQYPTPPENVNLNKLTTLKNSFPDLVLGFSDHTQGPLAASLAVALGASIFEKHFTLNHTNEGPDHWFSEDPNGLKTWVDSIRNSYQLMGSGILRPTAEELKMRLLARRSLIAINDLQLDEQFSVLNVGLRRPGIGLAPKFIDTVVGKKSTKFISKGSLIQFGDFI